MRRRKQFPGATPYTDRHGRRRWRFRGRGFSRELGKDYGSEQFVRRYEDARREYEGRPGAGADRTKPATFDDLAVKFYALHFPSLAPTTRKDYRAVIEPLRLQHGKKRVAHLKARHVLAIKAHMSDTPQQANKTLKRLSQMMDLAMQLEWRTDNPVKGIARYRTASTGFHTWDEGEISRFYDTYQIGSPAYLAITLMLYTGASRADVVKMGWQNVAKGRIAYRRQKTQKSPEGIEVNIPIHPRLGNALEMVPAGTFTFLQTQQGRARTPNGLGTSMRKWCDKAGLPLCSSHGLRKAICRRLAEAGAEVFEIMSVSGHISIKEVQTYIAEFGRKDLSDAAIARLPNGVESEQKLANHPARFAKKTYKYTPSPA